MWHREPISGISFVFYRVQISKIQDGHLLTISFLSVLSHITHITCWISHEKLVFSNMCLFPVIISCILRSPNIQIQDGHRWSYWKCTSKENGSWNWCNTSLPIKCFTQSPFLKSFCILTSLNVEIQDGRPLPFPLFSYLSHPIHCSYWTLHQKLVSSITCWFYMVLLHIFCPVTNASYIQGQCV